MTTLGRVKEQCFACGETCQYESILSTNRRGWADLDTRPPGMARSTIVLSIQRCPYCGYCAPKVSRFSERASETIRSEKYLHQLKDQRYPRLANSFLCWAIIREEVGSYAEGGWAAIHAAWICDDWKPESAASCRNRAIELFQNAKAKGDSFAQDVGVEEAILADLFRRSGQFDEVKPVCEAGLSKKPKEVTEHVLVYQIALAARQDTGCHTIGQAVEYAEGS